MALLRHSAATVAVVLFASTVTQVAHGTPRIGPEQPADATVVDSIDSGIAQRSAFAAVPGGILVFWTDRGFRHRIARVTPDGRFDPSRLALDPATAGSPYDVRMYSYARGALLVYRDYTHAYRAIHFDELGVAREAAPIPLPFGGTMEPRSVQAACSATLCVVAAMFSDTLRAELRWLTVRDDGSTGPVYTRALPPFANMAIGSNGSGFLVANASDDGPLEIQTLGNDGAAAGAPRTLGPRTRIWTMSIASDGDAYGFAVSGNVDTTASTAVNALFVRELQRDGRDGRFGNLVVRGVSPGRVSTAWDGSRYQFLTEEGGSPGEPQAVAVALDPATQTLDPMWTVASELAGYPHEGSSQLAVSAGRTWALWTQRLRLPFGDFATARIVAFDRRDAPRIVPGVNSDQRSPSLVATPDGSVLLWVESRTNLGEFFARRFDPDGTLTSPARFGAAMESIGATNFQAIAAGDDVVLNWLPSGTSVSYTHSMLSARRWDGRELWSADVSGVSFDPPRIVYGAGHLAFMDNNQRTIGFTVDPRGSEYLDMSLLGRIEYPRGSDVFFDGTAFQAWWTQNDGTSRRARIDPSAGRAMPPTFDSPAAVADGRLVRIAAGGSRYLMLDGTSRVSVRRLDAVTGSAIDAARLDLGNSLESATSDTSFAGSRAEVSFDGRAFILAWVEAVGARAELHVARIDPLSATLAADSAPVAPGVGVRSFSIVVEAPGRARIAYARQDETLGVARVFHRELSWDDTREPQAARCARNEQCASGFCVDGVCCDSACAGGSSDCFACSIARGGAVDGVCGAAPSACEVRDGGVSDAGEAPDAGHPEDAGVTADVVRADAIVRDASSSRGDGAVDAGGSDASAPRVDGAVDVGGSESSVQVTGGCGCTVPSSGTRTAGMRSLVLAIGVLVLRRRARPRV